MTEPGAMEGRVLKMEPGRAGVESWLKYCLGDFEQVHWAPWDWVFSYVKYRYGIGDKDKNTNFTGWACKIHINQIYLDACFSQNGCYETYATSPDIELMPLSWMWWIEKSIFQIDFDSKFEQILCELLK